MFRRSVLRIVIMIKQALHVHGCTWTGTDKIPMFFLHCAWWAVNTRSYWLTNSR